MSDISYTSSVSSYNVLSFDNKYWQSKWIYCVVCGIPHYYYFRYTVEGNSANMHIYMNLYNSIDMIKDI